MRISLPLLLALFLSGLTTHADLPQTVQLEAQSKIKAIFTSKNQLTISPRVQEEEPPPDYTKPIRSAQAKVRFRQYVWGTLEDGSEGFNSTIVCEKTVRLNVYDLRENSSFNPENLLLADCEAKVEGKTYFLAAVSVLALTKGDGDIADSGQDLKFLMNYTAAYDFESGEDAQEAQFTVLASKDLNWKSLITPQQPKVMILCSNGPEEPQPQPKSQSQLKSQTQPRAEKCEPSQRFYFDANISIDEDQL